MSEIFPERLQAALGDRYSLIRELGRGGMATVYLARDIANDRDVAIKVLLPDLASVLGPERFRREIAVATSLSHPNILAMYDSGEADGTLYCVMPYVDGESLRAKLEREKQLPVHEALRITAEVASALDVAHKQGVVHRDIKPENILLETNGTAVVADFGIARAVSGVGDERLTKTGLTLGTPSYMSPEQATAERQIDGRSDIYALGCVLYEMLAGMPPFTGPNAQAVTSRHIVDDPPSVTSIRRTVPPHVEQCIYVAMAKSPADRFTTAAEFGAALGDVTGRTLTRYTAAHPVPRMVAARHRPTSWRRLALLAPVLLLAAGALFVWVARSERGDSVAAPLESRLDASHVAVLYFNDHSASGELSYVADALTEGIIGAFRGDPYITMISAEGVAPYRNTDVSWTEVATELQSGTLVIGAVEPFRDGYRVNVRLVDGESGADIERAPAIEVAHADALSAHETVVQSVSEVLRRRLGLERELRRQRAGTENSNAWVLVRRAERLRKEADSLIMADQPNAADQALVRADSLLSVAETQDTRWAEPSVLRAAISRERVRRLYGDPLRASEVIDAGLAHAERALRLTARHANALELRGTLKLLRVDVGLLTTQGEIDRAVREAEADLLEAVKVNPTQATAYNTLSLLEYRKQNVRESFNFARLAYEHDAYLRAAPDILWRLYVTAYDLEDPINAQSWCDRAYARYPGDVRFTRCRLWLMTMPRARHDVAEAWRLVGELEQMTPGHRWEYVRREAQIVVAAVLARAGEADSARALLLASRAGRDVDPRGELTGYEAFVRSSLGDQEEAIQLLQRYLTDNPDHRAGFARANAWWWRNLERDARFQALVGGSG